MGIRKRILIVQKVYFCIVKSILYIAWRYLFIKKSTQSINILSGITMVAMCGGAMALVLVLSTFNGFEDLAVTFYESFQPSLIVESKDSKTWTCDEAIIRKVRKVPGVTAVSKTISEKAYFKYNDHQAIGIIKGIDSSYFNTSQLKKCILFGQPKVEDLDHSYAIVGAGIDQMLNVNYQQGIEQLAVYLPSKELHSIGGTENQFESSYLVPSAVFSIEKDIDEKYVFAPLSFVQYLTQGSENSVSAIEISTLPSRESEVRKSLRSLFSNTSYSIKTRLESNESLYKITQIEKMIVILVMVFILCILSFNFIGSLTMHHIEKAQDLKTLYYIGMTPKNIRQLYLTIAILQGSLGGITGIVLGIIVCFLQQKIGIVAMPSGHFVVQYYPVLVKPSDIFMIFGIIVAISFLAGLIPSNRAMHTIKKQ